LKLEFLTEISLISTILCSGSVGFKSLDDIPFNFDLENFSSNDIVDKLIQIN